MDIDNSLTEQDIIDKLIARASFGGYTVQAIVISRTQKQRSFKRDVRVAIVTNTNNETLIDSLIDECLINDNQFYFAGSEVNLQDNIEIDYLFFDCAIMSKKQEG